MTTPTTDAAKQLYREAIVIDCLNVSNWESPAVFQSLYAGGGNSHQRHRCDVGKLSRDFGQHRCLVSAT